MAKILMSANVLKCYTVSVFSFREFSHWLQNTLNSFDNFLFSNANLKKTCQKNLEKFTNVLNNEIENKRRQGYT
jgi:hypothetical protein